MGSNWVDYQKVKESVSIRDVLEKRGHEFATRPDGSLHARCPIHKGHNTRQFKVTANGRGFHCFGKGCLANGNVIDFVAALDTTPFRDAAIKIAQEFEVHSALVRPGAPTGKRKTKKTRSNRRASSER